jgi:hypothetical protein
MKYLLLFHSNSCCTNPPRCYVSRTLPLLFQHILDRHCGLRPCPFPDVNQSELDADHSPPSTGTVLLLALYALMARTGTHLCFHFYFHQLLLVSEIFDFGIFHPLCYTITWCNVYRQIQHNNVCPDYRDVIVKFNMTTCFVRPTTIFRSTRVSIYYMQRKNL